MHEIAIHPCIIAILVQYFRKVTKPWICHLKHWRQNGPVTGSLIKPFPIVSQVFNLDLFKELDIECFQMGNSCILDIPKTVIGKMLLTKWLASPQLNFGIISDLNILRVQKHKFFLLKNSINNSEHKPTNKRIIAIHQQHNLIIRTIVHNPMID